MSLEFRQGALARGACLCINKRLDKLVGDSHLRARRRVGVPESLSSRSEPRSESLSSRSESLSSHSESLSSRSESLSSR